jgi:hypothetical protein
MVALLRALADRPLAEAAKAHPEAAPMSAHPAELMEFVEGLYDFWRQLDRFMVCHSEAGPDSHDRRPYRTFNATVGRLAEIVRGVYRDVGENITGDHPRVYRQVAAGCDAGLIAVSREWQCPAAYTDLLRGIPFIRQVLINPPLIMDPPMNRRTGQFAKVRENPLVGMRLEKSKWLCYPARVGPLVVFIYFHQRFMGLGCSLANLFALATDEEIAKGPDAVYLFGAPSEALAKFGDLPTVFHDDEAAGLIAAAVPEEDRFGYFGYLKKMVLTLHNVVMIRRGRLPFHGAMMRLVLRGGKAANVLLIGDTATGKSETIEAMRLLAEREIRKLVVVADDMGSIEVAPDGSLTAYGTEIGAFVRLDDLGRGYVFAQLDRAVIMSPQKVNARVVVPITTLEEVMRGHVVHFLLYANNYEEVDPEHPPVERFDSPERALAVFRDGAAMSKGTTTATGLVHTYFANIFGPPQYREQHEALAEKVFAAAFRAGVFVGQMRTRLGIEGFERAGPQEAAGALLALIRGRT